MANQVTNFVQLTTAFQSVAAVPPGVTYALKLIHLTNTTNAPRTVQVCYVPATDTPTQSNALLWDFSIPANDFLEFGEGDVLSAGSSIRAKASANTALNLKFSAQAV